MRLAAIAFISVLCVPAVAAAETVEVTASGLNIRSGPSSGYRVIGVAPRGERMTVAGRTGDWLRVNFRGRSGYGYGRYLRTVSAPSTSTSTSSGSTSSSGTLMTVTADSLNVRTGPSTGYRRVGTLSRGARVRVVASSGAWRKIEFNGGTGWVHGAYLSTSSTGGGSTGSTGGTSAGGPSQAGFIKLPASGRGFSTYYSSSRKWGAPRLIYGIQRVARRYIQSHPGASRVQVGDISAMNGGRISGHSSHRRGVDGDFRPASKNGREGAVTRFQSAYSRTLTRSQLQLFEAELNVSHIFFNDANIRTAHRQYWRNHDNHYHVRIR